MRNLSKLSALSLLLVGFIQPTASSAAPLKSSKVMKDLIRQCEYVDGVVLRVLLPRECPTLKTAAPTPAAQNVPEVAVQQPVIVNGGQSKQGANAATSDDIILEKAISRCTNIGFKRETPEFRSCVTEQITILSK